MLPDSVDQGIRQGPAVMACLRSTVSRERWWRRLEGWRASNSPGSFGGVFLLGVCWLMLATDQDLRCDCEAEHLQATTPRCVNILGA